jgi:hypothetical protein
MTTNQTTATTPVVGMGATYGYGSDSYPYTVVRISPSGKTLWVKRDEVLHLTGSDMSGDSTYVTMPNDDAPEEQFTLRADGHWLPKGPRYARQRSLTLGHRRYYQDPSF